MHITVTYRRVLTSALILLGALLGLSAVSLAASPAKGARFSGNTNESPSEPVSFVVSSSATALKSFQFKTLGCLASPGQTAFAVKVGTLKLSRSGGFSVTGAKAVNTHRPKANLTIVTTITVTVSGTFTSRTAASGTIRYSQRVSTNGAPGPKCTAAKPLTFHATG